MRFPGRVLVVAVEPGGKATVVVVQEAFVEESDIPVNLDMLVDLVVSGALEIAEAEVFHTGAPCPKEPQVPVRAEAVHPPAHEDELTVDVVAVMVVSFDRSENLFAKLRRDSLVSVEQEDPPVPRSQVLQRPRLLSRAAAGPVEIDYLRTGRLREFARTVLAPRVEDDQLVRPLDASECRGEIPLLVTDRKHDAQRSLRGGRPGERRRVVMRRIHGSVSDGDCPRVRVAVAVRRSNATHDRLKRLLASVRVAQLSLTEHWVQDDLEVVDQYARLGDGEEIVGGTNAARAC